MIYQIPALNDADRDVLGLIAEQRTQLRYRVDQNPHRWTGFLRRNTFARALQGSNSIEGYNATLADVVAIIDDERPETPEEETIKALGGYRTALTYILQMHGDPHFTLNAQVIKSLHFMMLSYDLTKHPGQWRSRSIYVVHESTGETVYEGPDAELVPTLMDELVVQLQTDKALDPVVRGAMAHLNLIMIHPFKDGNGRMARALQTLIIARGGILSPLFSSIEEWLGQNTSAYYDILASTGRGRWSPERDALPWVRFCLIAHFQQAATLLRRNREIGRAWDEISKLVSHHRLDERSEPALIDATFGFRVRNNHYREQNNISDVVASRDLKRLCDIGLLAPIGEKRGRYYVAASPLREIRERTQESRKAEDPYALIRETQAKATELSFPGSA